MKIWMSSETHKDVDPQYKEIEEKINNFIAEQDYGNAIESLDIIHMIFPERILQVLKWPEVRQYDPKTKDTEFRLKIDHDTFLHADEEGKRRLLLKNIIDAIRYLKGKIKKKDFDADRLEQDILNLFSVNSYESLTS